MLLVQGNTTVVMETVANLTSLQFVDLTGNTGITGTIDSGAANTNLCKAAQVCSPMPSIQQQHKQKSQGPLMNCLQCPRGTGTQRLRLSSHFTIVNSRVLVSRCLLGIASNCCTN